MKKFAIILAMILSAAVMLTGCGLGETEEIVYEAKDLYDSSIFEEGDEPVGEPQTIEINAFYKDSSDYGVENITVKFTGEGFDQSVTTDASGHFSIELPNNTKLNVSVTDSTGALICDDTFNVITDYEEGYYSYAGDMELFVPMGTTLGYITFYEKPAGVMDIAYESLSAADTTIKSHFVEDTTVDEDGDTVAE